MIKANVNLYGLTRFNIEADKQEMMTVLLAFFESTFMLEGEESEDSYQDIKEVLLTGIAENTFVYVENYLITFEVI